jgi:outer membrane protein
MAKQNNYASEKIGYFDQVRNNVSSNVGFIVRIPILNYMQARNRVKLAEINVKNAALVEESTRLQLRQDIDQVYLNLTNSWDRYKVLEEQVAAYAESFRAAEIRFNAGAGTSVDYMIAKNNFDRASLNLVVAKYDYVLRTKVLDYYNGAQ